MKLFDGFNQFINWIPRIRKNGKTDKIPIGITGNAINSMDSCNWMSEKQAHANAIQQKCGVGFVFTENDPFFFIDIDNAVENDKWSNLAHTIMSAFPGCAVEISQSGKGLHIFGTGNIGAYTSRNTKNHLEFYTKNRFVALTGTAMVGNSAIDGTAGLRWLIKNYFSEEKTGISIEWTDIPCTEWNGEKK